MTEKKSAEQLVYDTLKSAILARTLAPGSQLVEIPISERLNISRTPIRNAIRKLSSEGLVNIIPNKGAFVVNPTKDEIKQAYSLRMELELIAAKQTINYLVEEDFEHMHQCIKDEVKALEDKNLVDYLEANKNFHMVVTERSRNKFLIEFMRKLINETNIYLILFDEFFEELSSAPKGPVEHKEIISKLQQKDLSKIEEVLTSHFEHAIESLSLQNRGYKSLEDLF